MSAPNRAQRRAAARRRTKAVASTAILATGAATGAVVAAGPLALPAAAASCAPVALTQAAVQAVLDNAACDGVDLTSFTGVLELESTLTMAVTDSGVSGIFGPGSGSLEIRPAASAGDFTLVRMTPESDVDFLEQVTVSGVTFYGGGSTSDDGGAIEFDCSYYAGYEDNIVVGGDIIVSDVLFDSNQADDGGGFHVERCGSVLVTDSVFVDNFADSDGGAISFDQVTGSITIENSDFFGNVALDEGGALYLDGEEGGDSLVISGSTFDNNSGGTEEKPGGGGAVSTDGVESVTISFSSFLDNTTVELGGALEIFDGSTLVVTNSVFAGNAATGYPAQTATGLSGGDGGAIFVDDTTGDGTEYAVILANSTFTGNTAASDGGAIDVDSNVAGSLLAQLTIVGNQADAGEDPVDINGDDGDGIFIDTSDTSGGGVAGAVVISGSIIAGNGERGQDVFIEQSNDETSPEVLVSDSVIGFTDGDLSSITDEGGNQFEVTDPGLEALADNGGPTLTMALKDDSVARDAAGTTVADFPGNEYDQRGEGFPRIINGRADAGAFEALPVEPTPVTPTFAG